MVDGLLCFTNLKNSIYTIDLWFRHISYVLFLFFFLKKGNNFYIRYNNYWKLLLKKNDNKNYF